MKWSDLLGHCQQKQWFQTAVANHRLATSFLFVGPHGIGKRTFATLLAQGLLCAQTPHDSIEACGQCEACVQVAAGTHPDLIRVSKPPEKAFIPIELLIGERDKRMREGLCHDLSLRPYSGRRKIAIIDDADYFNNEGANCLLKTLEEPPLDSMLILIGSSLQRQLPTIRSRCQAILFQPLEPPQVQTLLLRNGIAQSEEHAAQLASQCGGNLEEAALLAEPDIDEFRRELFQTLAAPQLPILAFAKKCSAIVDAAGKDARLKRERMKLVLRFAATFFRELALATSATADRPVTPATDTELAAAVKASLAKRSTGRRGASLAWHRCLVAIEQVDRNANQTTLLETWTTDIAQCC